MSDDKSKVGGNDRTRINTSEEYEVQYWSEKFNVSPDELRRAVESAGSNEVSRIEEYLSK